MDSHFANRYYDMALGSFRAAVHFARAAAIKLTEAESLSTWQWDTLLDERRDRDQNITRRLMELANDWDLPADEASHELLPAIKRVMHVLAKASARGIVEEHHAAIRNTTNSVN